MAIPKSALWLVMCAWLVSIAVPEEALAGRLSGAKSSVRSGSSSSSRSSSSRSSSSRSSSSRSSSGGWSNSGWGLQSNWWWWTLSPWWLPGEAMNDSWTRQVAFPSAPYIDGIDGYVRVAGQTPPAPGMAEAQALSGRTVLGHGSALRVHLEGGAADMDLQRGAAGFVWSGAHRFELSGELRGFLERLPDGSREQLWIGSGAVSLLFAQNEFAQFRSGLGMRFMPDGDVTHRGWHLLYGFDLYPMRPLVLSIQGDIGMLGEAGITSLRGTAGAVVGQVEVYGGYEGLWIGDVDLSTWVIGMRLWQ